jgi:PAS domain S-box-containing protein
MSEQHESAPASPGVSPSSAPRQADSRVAPVSPPKFRPAEPRSDPNRSVIEDQTELLARFRADGTLTFVNEAFCRLFGKSNAELIGSLWQSVAAAEDLPAIEEQLRGLSADNPVVVVENRVVVAGGDVRWMQFVNRGFFDPAGQMIETQCVGRDIHDRVLAELALRKSEARALAAFEAAPIGMALVSLDGRLVKVNRAFAKMLGYDA